MRVILKEDFEVLARIREIGNRLIDGAIVANDPESWDIWQPVFNKIFSEEMSGKIYEILTNFDPYILDTSYSEDVCSFWGAFEREMNDVKIV